MQVTSKGTSEKRELKLESSFKTLFAAGKCTMSNQFSGSKLKSARATNYSRNTLMEQTTTEYIAASDYQVILRSKNLNKEEIASINPNQPTVLSLYVHEPINVKEVYSERFGVLCPLKKIGEGKYALATPDGRVSEYFYQNGVCKELHMKIGTFKIQVGLRKMT